ncbi:MAG: nuclear transport factor 2 family protein [Thermoanaerobaculia bacterium]|nr:nuclear transport factor 2 family protein [Thermoanaerobaculia bacterium]
MSHSSLVRLVALLALVGALVALGLWWTSDRRRIVAQFEALQEELGKSGEEGTFDRLGHARGVSEIFADGFVILAEPYEGTIADRQQLMAIVDRYRASAERITVSDSEVEVELRPNATAEMTAVVEVIGLRPGGPGRERLRIRVAWREDDGVWRIQELEVLEVLDSSGLFF